MDSETIEAMERDYMRGFNDGYMIAERLPDLAKQLSHKSLEAPWFEGFRDGREQYAREQARELRPSWLRADRNANAPSDRTEPGKDMAQKKASETLQGRDRQQDIRSEASQGQENSGTAAPRRDKNKDRDPER